MTLGIRPRSSLWLTVVCSGVSTICTKRVLGPRTSIITVLGVSTRLIETVEYEKETMKSIIWLAFWNLGTTPFNIHNP